MRRKMVFQLGIVSASTLNFAGTTLLIIIWNWDLSLFLPILVVSSCLMGMTVVDIKRAIAYACVSVFLGSALVMAIISTPPILLGEGPMRIDAAITTALTAVSKLLIFSLTLYILSALLGSFVGELLEPLEEYEIS